MMVLPILATLLVVPAVLAAGYYLVLALVGMGMRRPPGQAPARSRHRFVILIPAHNEAANIDGALQSCAELDYPAELLQVVVVADNCTDGTAACVRSAGWQCLERQDPRQRGKGHALAWAIPRVLAGGADALVILDADCQLDSHALQVLDQHLSQGDRVLQTNYVASNPDSSIVSYVTAIANLLENDLYYGPKDRLGLAVLLRGTGMVFHRTVLEQVPWKAYSIVEDADFTVKLYEAGFAIRFVPSVRVYSAFPERQDQLKVQRSRWIGGMAGLTRTQVFRLIRQAGQRPVLLDLAWTLLVTSRSLVLLELVAAGVVSLLAAMLAPGAWSRGLVAMSAGLLGFYLAYFCLGLALLGLDRHRWQLLRQSPAALARVFGIAAVSILPGRHQDWVRTPR
jgi:cellulose synthase/poly-beta-1,6-N-acetylglucosamine synthase-like glycosyltransferase